MLKFLAFSLSEHRLDKRHKNNIIFVKFSGDIDKLAIMCYNVRATQTTYFFSDTGKYFGKKCFLSFLMPYRREFV